jgi:hypothetical protein
VALALPAVADSPVPSASSLPREDSGAKVWLVVQGRITRRTEAEAVPAEALRAASVTDAGAATAEAAMVGEPGSDAFSDDEEEVAVADVVSLGTSQVVFPAGSAK